MSDAKQTAPDQDCEQLAKQVQDLQDQLANKEEAHKRALADYQNLRRQTALEKQQVRQQATANLVEQLLPIVDNLNRVLEHFEDQSLSMIVEDLQRTLAQQGLEEIKIEVGKTKFDHQLMEAVDAQSGPEQVVMAQQQVGYTLNGLVIRHAQVIVGKDK